ncbi:MAG: HEAT repeat domain-containing protein [Methanospirillum sp.]
MSSDTPTIDDAVGPLLGALREVPDPAVRAFTALTLGQCNRPAAVPALIAAFSDPDKVVRAAAARALSSLGPEAVPALIAALDDPSWVVRYRAAEALGRIRDPRVVPALLTLLDDERDHVRYMAAKGLGIDSAPAAVDALILRLDDENPFVRRMAAQALRSVASHLGGPDTARIESALASRD